MAPVGGRQMDIDHLHARELLQDRPRRQPRRSRSGQVLQGDVQAVGNEGDEDVRLDPRLTMHPSGPELWDRSFIHVPFIVPIRLTGTRQASAVRVPESVSIVSEAKAPGG